MIGKLLGHARIETTARYAHLARDSERESAACIRTVRPIIFYKFNRDPAVAAGHLVTALGDQPGTTLTWVMGTAKQARKGSGNSRSTATPTRSLCAPGAGSRGCDGIPPPALARNRPGRSRSPGYSGTAPSRPRSSHASNRLRPARAGA